MIGRAIPPMVWRGAGLIILVLWVLSLSQPVFYACGQYPQFNPVIGFAILLWGWLEVIHNPAWLANPFIVAAGVSYLVGWRRVWFPFVLSALGCGLALMSLSWTLTLRGESMVPSCGRGAGYWLWLASGALALVVAIIRWPMDNKRPGTGDPYARQ